VGADPKGRLRSVGRVLTKDHADRAKRSRAAGLWRSAEDVTSPGDLELHKTGTLDQCCYLFFQKSTRNSTGPQRDILFSARRHGLLDEDIRDLKAPAGPEHTCHLRQGGILVGDEIEHAV